MINSQWRAVQSFQENQDISSPPSILLSIHIKLKMAGHGNSSSEAETIANSKGKTARDF